MASPRRFLRALVATGTLGAGLALAAGPVAPAAQAADPVPVEVDDAPLGLTITRMTPASLPVVPRDGDITVSGTLTNRTDETWRGISLYAFAGDEIGGVPVEPMRNQGQLALAMQEPFEEVVGERKTASSDSVDELAPGASVGYTVVLPAEALQVTRAGVYWFGVHALGESDSVGTDEVADGRVRTFLPYVPPRFQDDPVDAAVVVPLLQPVRYAADGSVDDVDGWERALRPGGRLSRLLDLADDSPAPLTWLVDPALVDAVAHLARGNPPRDLGPVVTDDPTGSPSESTEEPADEAEAAAEPLSGSALAAGEWLRRLGEAAAGDEVLAVPYGNVDVGATLAHDPELLEVALAQRSTELERLGISPRTAVTSPSGYLDAESIAAAPADATVLVTDRMFGSDPPAAAEVDGRRVLVTSYGATQGSPGPGRSLTSVGVRQRLLAEAAVRVIKNKRQPLVTVLPLGWALDDPDAFWAALDQSWIDLGTLGDAESSAPSTAVDAVSTDDLDYSARQERRRLDEATVDAVAGLVDAGDRLQSMLVDNTEIAGTVTEEALTGLSYFVRYGQVAGRVATGRSRGWVDARLGGVTIDTRGGVTLSSANGEFVVTLTNTLDHRVAVSVRAESDDGIEVITPERVVLPPQGRESILLEARTTTNAVHNVELMVTDVNGQPLGSTDELPIRPTQVSGVIWIIMGTGAGLLFLAIAVRLVRRIGAARRGEPGAGRRSSREAAGSSPVEAV